MFFSITLTVAIIGIVGAASMLFYRMWELQTGKISMPEERKTFFPLRDFFSYALRCENEYGPKVFKFLCRHGERAHLHAKRLGAMMPVSDKMIEVVDAVKGRVSLVKRESNSTFLKTISAHKNKIRNGE